MNSNEILNKYIDLIDKGYCCDCNELNCIDNFPHAKITHGIRELQQENAQLKNKLSKIETLIINHNCDTGDIYYKYNSKFLKSELKQRILEILYEEGSDSNE